MEELQAYAPEEIILANLEELTDRILKSGEQERAHLRELAEEIRAAFEDPALLLSSLAEHRLPTPSAAHHVQTNAERALLQALTTARRARLCMELKALLPHPEQLCQELFSPVPENLELQARNRISYQKNRFTEPAYNRFAALIDDPRATYAESFPAACENVYNGVSEFCILPLESSMEGRLNSFTRLILRYELKIVATCNVATEGGQSTRFALLRRNGISFAAAKDVPMQFELSAELAQEPSAEEILSAARQFGLRLRTADVSLTEEGASLLHAVFLTDRGDLPAFLLYLGMELPAYDPIGYYPDLSAEPSGNRKK